MGLARLEVLALEVKVLLLGPESFDDGHPLVGCFIQVVMVYGVQAEHGDLVRLLPGDHVQRRPPPGDVVHGASLLGGEHRMDHANMRGVHNLYLRGKGGDASGPGEHLEGLVVEVGGAPKASPAAQGQQELPACLVHRLSDTDVLIPGGSKGTLGAGDGGAVAHVQAEDAQLEGVVVEQW